MCSPGVSGLASTGPYPSPRRNTAPPRSASTRLKLRHSPASSRAIACGRLGAREPPAAPAAAIRPGCACPAPAPGSHAVQHRGDHAGPLIPIHVPPPERSRPATTSGCSGQYAAGGSHARASVSSRLAASVQRESVPGAKQGHDGAHAATCWRRARAECHVPLTLRQQRSHARDQPQPGRRQTARRQSGRPRATPSAAGDLPRLRPQHHTRRPSCAPAPSRRLAPAPRSARPPARATAARHAR